VTEEDYEAERARLRGEAAAALRGLDGLDWEASSTHPPGGQ
jgi:hypothetical protein